MHWSSNGLIIGTRKHGETSVIVEAMVFGKGRHLGLVRGGRSKRLSASLQIGNSVELTWRARLDEHLGNFSIELDKARAAAMINDKKQLFLGQLLCEHLRLLPERDPHDNLLIMALSLLDDYEDNQLLAIDLVRFELFLLEELGFGLDLSCCVISGETNGLSHISPKSGHAVTSEHGSPYLHRLLALPQFLISDENPSNEDITNGFILSKHFLSKHIWLLRQNSEPSTRAQLIDLLLNK